MSYPRSLAITFIAGGPQAGGAGKAYLDQLCSRPGAYGYVVVNPSFPFGDLLGGGTLPHEIGHIFGSPHASCYSPLIDKCPDNEMPGCYTGVREEPAIVTIMSKCTNRTRPLRFDAREASLMRTKAEAAACLTQVSTVTVPVSHDAYVSSAAPDNSYGILDYLNAGRIASQGKSGVPLRLRSVVHFNLTPTLPGGVAIIQASLWVMVSSGQGSPTISVSRLASSFSENSATWNNTNAVASPPAALSTQQAIREGWKVFDVTNLVTDCRVNRLDQCYWRLSEENEDDNLTSSQLIMGSREFVGDGAARLKITYVQ